MDRQTGVEGQLAEVFPDHALVGNPNPVDLLAI
jgi:hypothetical protein